MMRAPGRGGWWSAEALLAAGADKDAKALVLDGYTSSLLLSR